MAQLFQTIDLIDADAASDQPCTGPTRTGSTFPPATDVVTLRATGERSDTAPSYYTPRSALFHLDPSDRVVAHVHLKQLARSALEFPESADWLRMHAKDWWCGMFHGQREGPPEACYVERDVGFEAEWASLLSADPSTFETTIGTLYQDASNAGWPALTTRELHTKQESVDSWQELRDLQNEVIDQLVKAVAAGNATAPFDKHYLEALAYLNDDDPYTYAHIKTILQRSNPPVSLAAIDVAVAHFPYKPLLPPLRTNAHRPGSKLLAKVGAAHLPGRHGAPLDGKQTQHRAVVDSYLQRVKLGDLASLDSEEFLVAICHIFFDDQHLFRSLGREFLAANSNVPWTDIESYVAGYEASLQVDDLRDYANEHKESLQTMAAYFEGGGPAHDTGQFAECENYLAFFHPIEYLRVTRARDEAIAEACRAALDAEWTRAEA